MFRLLVDAEPLLSGAGVNVNAQDRLGRTPLHIAAQFGLSNLVKILLTDSASGGLAANSLIGDQLNQRAIHYAIQFKQVEVFEVFLDFYEAERQQSGADSLQEINCGSIPYTLASFCVVRQSWRCLAKLLERKGLEQLNLRVQLDGFDQCTSSKTPKQFA